LHVDSEKLADFLLGAPLAVLVIVIGAAIVNRILRRTLQRGLPACTPAASASG
jgi:hypothetical protein